MASNFKAGAGVSCFSLDKNNFFACLANFQFSTSAMLFCEFDSLVGYRSTEKDMKAYNLVLGRFFEASVCII